MNRNFEADLPAPKYGSEAIDDQARPDRRSTNTTAMAWLLLPVIVLFFFIPVCLSAQTSAGGAFQPEDLFRIQSASDVQISPTGEFIAYVRLTPSRRTDRVEGFIWLIDVNSGRQRPLGRTPGRPQGSPRWSPDGERLAYVATAEDGTRQIEVSWVRQGTSARLTSLPDAPGDLTWSPDGRLIAFSMFEPSPPPMMGERPAAPEGAEWALRLQTTTSLTYRWDGQGFLSPGATHIFVLSSDGGAPRRVTSGEVDDSGGLSWLPDGRHLIFSGRRSPGWERLPSNTDLFRVSLETGEVTRLTDRIGPDDAPMVSPDGSMVAYVGYDDRPVGYLNTKLYILDLSTGVSRSLTDHLDRSVRNPQWTSRGREILFQFDDQGETYVGAASMTGRTRRLFGGLAGSGLDRPYTGGSFTAARNGLIGAAVGDAATPPEVALYRDGRVRRLTSLNEQALAGKTLAAVRPLEIPSSVAGRPLQAWLVLPPFARPGERLPLVLEIHGGPYQAYGAKFSSDIQLMAAAGYAVLYTNPRGSTSYGEAFANAIQDAYPGSDFDDLMTVVDAVVAQGVADPNRLYVTGSSGGGMLTLWAVGRSDRFAAAAAQKPVVNWISEVLTTDDYFTLARYWFRQMPWEAPEHYWARSPLSLVGNVSTPTLLLVGSRDLRTPPSEAEQYYQALRLRSVPAALTLVPEASHNSLAARPSQSAERIDTILRWFASHRRQ